MSDPRTRALADILVNYSARVQPGDWVIVRANVIAEPLADEVVRAVLRAGGNPAVELESDAITETRIRVASDEQLGWVSPLERTAIEKADALIMIGAAENTRALTSLDPARQQIPVVARSEFRDIRNRRAMAGEMTWVYTIYPCLAYAQEADMSLREFEDFVYQATYADTPNPVDRWHTLRDEQQRYVDWLVGKERVEIRGPNAEVAFSVQGRKFINSSGSVNMPSGEVFTSPIEDSANGWVEFSYPAIIGGREVEGVRLVFENGKVVEATARKNEAYLLSMLDSDPGARYLGEFAIGTNYGIDRFTKLILFDEKMGGTFHMALGNSYPETGGVNTSSIHWDMICDVREDSEIRVDGELLYRNGEFQI